ncbi:FGGY-family carbohydrate kinase [Azospirillum thermophilum]|uniref:Ribulokinase n=1 Tax=Azospirillum thermophilum TaxID=2202148 RepID=A0A2S2CYG4_9PROT|nr:FGGY-family carbohydrate kinase [Azospirillum thermophilum]AWK89509.1 ribulokinase [Azospirillum thermophilum]
MADLVLGIDVGTGSARAGLFDLSGRRIASASRGIRMWHPEPDFAEQSSDDIWQAVVAAARQALAAAGPADRVAGIGFDATCSLVVLDAAGRPVSVSPTGDDAQNVIVWMDHRAIAQADRINALGHEVLRYVGGRISPEMQTPKLLWLKERLPQAWSRAAHVFDLPDFLTWRATGAASRSLCSTVCKWTYLGHEGRWDEGYFRSIGLGDLADEGFARIGTEVLPIARPVGRGLSAAAAAELGLPPGTPVGTSLIDAHAGGVGVIGAAVPGCTSDFGRRLALIGGTSSCHMAVSQEPRFVPGVWGPYFSAMVPGLWLNEGGQSATGALIDHVIASHARGAEAAAEAARGGRTVYELLNGRLDALAAAAGGPVPAALTRELHVMPDFHGNRSPRADATLRGMISGLRLSDELDELALLYLATIQAVAYGTRHIVEALNARGYGIDTILVCGGGTKNPVFLREHADATGCRFVLPEEPEAVLLGSAILGAVAGGAFPTVTEAMAAMTRAGRSIEPAAGAAAFHRAKYAVFHRMYEDQMAYRALMSGV